MNPGPPGALPAGLRRVVVIALIVGALVGFGSAQSMAQVLEPPSLEGLDKAAPPLAGGPDLSRVSAAFVKSYVRSLDGMKGSRVAILMALSVAASLLFVSSLRMLRPAGVPREGVRRLLGASALVCAVLRTLDGAQSTAAARRAADAVDKVAAEEAIGGWLPGAVGVVSVLIFASFTLLVSGGFTVLWMYFRSEKVREQVASLEKAEGGP